MEFKRVEKTIFNSDEMLKPLSKVERGMFLHSLRRIAFHESSITGRQALCVMILDLLHTSHSEELATITSVLVNKFMKPPFRGNRDMLKQCLESIMGAITAGEKMMDESK